MSPLRGKRHVCDPLQPIWHLRVLVCDSVYCVSPEMHMVYVGFLSTNPRTLVAKLRCTGMSAKQHTPVVLDESASLDPNPDGVHPHTVMILDNSRCCLPYAFILVSPIILVSSNIIVLSSILPPYWHCLRDRYHHGTVYHTGTILVSSTILDWDRLPYWYHLGIFYHTGILYHTGIILVSSTILGSSTILVSSIHQAVQ